MQVPQRSACGSSGGDVERGVDLAQEQPGTVRARDEVGVLALPADAGAFGQRLLHHRRGVDEHLHRRAEARHDELREVLQLALDHVVIVAVAGIDRDAAAVGLVERGERIVLRRIGQAEGDHAARRRPQRSADATRCSARRASQPMSPCWPAARNSASRSRASVAEFGVAEADSIEAQRQRAVADQATCGSSAAATIRRHVLWRDPCPSGGAPVCQNTSIGMPPRGYQ